jgi:hypothetical protein
MIIRRPPPRRQLPRKPTAREIAIANRFLQPRRTPRQRPQQRKPGEPQFGV